MIHFCFYYLPMSTDNTIQDIAQYLSFFIVFFVLFNYYIFTNHQLILFQGHQRVLINRSMSIDNVTWQASAALIYALKPSLKSKSSRNVLELSSFTFFLGVILLHLNDVHLLFKCILIKSIKVSLPLLTKLLRMTKIAIFLLFYL